jgi:hypothetical protein
MTREKTGSARFAGVSPAAVFSRKGRKERKDMKGGNEAKEVTLPRELRSIFESRNIK